MTDASWSKNLEDVIAAEQARGGALTRLDPDPTVSTLWIWLASRKMLAITRKIPAAIVAALQATRTWGTIREPECRWAAVAEYVAANQGSFPEKDSNHDLWLWIEYVRQQYYFGNLGEGFKAMLKSVDGWVIDDADVAPKTLAKLLEDYVVDTHSAQTTSIDEQIRSLAHLAGQPTGLLPALLPALPPALPLALPPAQPPAQQATPLPAVKAAKATKGAKGAKPSKAVADGTGDTGAKSAKNAVALLADRKRVGDEQAGHAHTKQKKRIVDIDKGSDSDEPEIIVKGSSTRPANGCSELEWGERYTDLLKYYSRHGDALPTRETNRALHDWIRTQHSQYASNNLAPVRVEMLGVLNGWIWPAVKQEIKQEIKQEFKQEDSAPPALREVTVIHPVVQVTPSRAPRLSPPRAMLFQSNNCTTVTVKQEAVFQDASEDESPQVHAPQVHAPQEHAPQVQASTKDQSYSEWIQRLMAAKTYVKTHGVLRAGHPHAVWIESALSGKDNLGLLKKMIDANPGLNEFRPLAYLLGGPITDNDWDKIVETNKADKRLPHPAELSATAVGRISALLRANAQGEKVSCGLQKLPGWSWEGAAAAWWQDHLDVLKAYTAVRRDFGKDTTHSNINLGGWVTMQMETGHFDVDRAALLSALQANLH